MTDAVMRASAEKLAREIQGLIAAGVEWDADVRLETRNIADMIESAILAERERCAKMVCCAHIADAIRRGDA